MIILYILFALVSALLIFTFTTIGYSESSDYSILEKKEILAGAEPVVYKNGNRKAVLFIHGFPGSPKMYYMVRELAVSDGFDVYSPLLPGFGTDHDQFIKSNFTMWFSYICDYYGSIRKDYDQFYIVGNSMGGAMTLKVAETFCDTDFAPTAIATVASPVKIEDPGARFTRTISLFKKHLPSKKEIKTPETDQDGDSEWVGYHGLFPKQVYSLKLALKTIRRDLYKIDVPCYFSHAREDKTVAFENLGIITNNISSKNVLVRMLSITGWNHTNHSLFIYKSYYKKLWSDIVGFFNSL